MLRQPWEKNGTNFDRHIDGITMTQVIVEIYATFLAAKWDKKLLHYLSVLCQRLWKAPLIYPSVIVLLISEARDSVLSLEADTLNATTYTCGLAICQMMSILRQRWPDVIKTAEIDETANHLRSLCLPLAIDFVQGNINQGHLIGLSVETNHYFIHLHTEPGCPLALVVELERSALFLVHKDICEFRPEFQRFELKAPKPEDSLTIPVGSGEDFDWWLDHMLIDKSED